MNGLAETRVMSDGFAFGAAAFGPFWALAFRYWRAAAVLGAGWGIAAALAFLAGPAGGAVIYLIVAYWSGFVGHGLAALSLEDKGWILQDVAVASDLDAAEAIMIRADAAIVDAAERRW